MTHSINGGICWFQIGPMQKQSKAQPFDFKTDPKELLKIYLIALIQICFGNFWFS